MKLFLNHKKIERFEEIAKRSPFFCIQIYCPNKVIGTKYNNFDGKHFAKRMKKRIS